MLLLALIKCVLTIFSYASVSEMEMRWNDRKILRMS